MPSVELLRRGWGWLLGVDFVPGVAVVSDSAHDGDGERWFVGVVGEAVPFSFRDEHQIAARQPNGLAIGQVHDILEALIEENEIHAREVAGRDNEIDRLYHRVFEELVGEMGNGKTDSDGALRSVTLLLVAHNLERIADRVTNVAEDIVFLETGQVVELG